MCRENIKYKPHRELGLRCSDPPRSPPRSRTAVPLSAAVPLFFCFYCFLLLLLFLMMMVIDEAGQSKPLDDRHSNYHTLDQLWRGCVKPEDLPALEDVKWDNKLWSLSNKRRADLKLLQLLQQQETAWVACVLHPPSHPKFRSSKTRT